MMQLRIAEAIGDANPDRIPLKSLQRQPTYEELAETIACCVHAQMYLPEPHKDGGWKKTVDNMSSTAYQIPIGVLSRLTILEPLDDSDRRLDFTCALEEFRGKIAENKASGCSYDTLVLALICLLELFPNEKNILEHLTRLGVCEGYDPTTVTPNDPKQQINWTDKKRQYEKLYGNPESFSVVTAAAALSCA